MEYWHCMFASEDRATLLPDETRVRAAVRAVVRVAPKDVVVFNLVDSHIHIVVLGVRANTGRLAQALGVALRKLVAAPLSPARIKPVNGRSHLEKLVAYVLKQDLGHGTGRHPALSTGSCFQDLAGARIVDGLRLKLRDALPRYRLRQAFLEMGLGAEPLGPADDCAVRRAGAERLLSAGTAAAGVGPDIRVGRYGLENRVRRCVAVLGRQAGISASSLGEFMGRSSRSVRRLAQEPGDDALMTAIRARIALENRVLDGTGHAERARLAWG